MKIAVTSQNFRSVTAHAGRARRFLVYDVQPGSEPVETGRFDLPREQTFHEASGTSAHPIDGVNVILSAGFKEHFAEEMARRGIRSAITNKENPLEAIRDYLVREAAGTLLPVTGCESGGECQANHQHEDPAGA